MGCFFLGALYGVGVVPCGEFGGSRKGRGLDWELGELGITSMGFMFDV